MTLSTSIIDPTTKGTTVSRALHVMLLIITCILVLTSILLVCIGVSMGFQNDVQDMILLEVKTKNIGSLDEGLQRRLIAITSFAYALICSAYAAVVLIIRKIVNTLRQGDPFVPANISRLRSIWIILAATEIVRMVLEIMGREPDENFVSIRLGTWFMVFVIAALSEVFRHGTALRQDKELTV